MLRQLPNILKLASRPTTTLMVRQALIPIHSSHRLFHSSKITRGCTHQVTSADEERWQIEALTSEIDEQKKQEERRVWQSELYNAHTRLQTKLSEAQGIITEFTSMKATMSSSLAERIAQQHSQEVLPQNSSIDQLTTINKQLEISLCNAQSIIAVIVGKNPQINISFKTAAHLTEHEHHRNKEHQELVDHWTTRLKHSNAGIKESKSRLSFYQTKIKRLEKEASELIHAIEDAKDLKDNPDKSKFLDAKNERDIVRRFRR